MTSTNSPTQDDTENTDSSLTERQQTVLNKKGAIEILAEIGRCEVCRFSELDAIVSVSRSTLSNRISDLKQMNFIQHELRQKQDSTAEYKVLTTTEAGDQIYTKIKDANLISHYETRRNTNKTINEKEQEVINTDK